MSAHYNRDFALRMEDVKTCWDITCVSVMMDTLLLRMQGAAKVSIEIFMVNFGKL